MLQRFFRATFTDSSGLYRFSNLPPGDYNVAIWADYDPGQALEPDILRRLEGTAVRVSAAKQGQESQARELRVTPEVRAIPQSYVR